MGYYEWSYEYVISSNKGIYDKQDHKEFYKYTHKRNRERQMNFQ